MIAPFYRKYWLTALFAALYLYCAPQGNKSPVNDGQPIKPRKFYSKEKPAEWIDFAADHAPSIEISKSKVNDNVMIYIVLKNPGDDHYIESIGILDEKDNIVEKEIIIPGKKVSAYTTFTFDITKDKSKYRAFARCSLHDLWITPFSQARNVP